jgi:ER-bound oxygenase mpaB/B'/Rubber oxygenase, catalytic domain
MHARVRRLLLQSGEWDAAELGAPLSAAHIGFATAAFSGLLLKRVAMLGIRLTPEEEQSFMLVWRYAGHLMGVPPALQMATQAEALHLHRIGVLCEPPPTLEAILLANGLINSAPIVAGITDPPARQRLARRIYSVSRALIGDTLADQLRYPPSSGFGVLAVLRLRNQADQLLRRISPGWDSRRRASQFARMMDLSFDDSSAISYRLPRFLHAERDG